MTKAMLCSELLHHPSLKQICMPPIFPPKEKFLPRSVLVLCVDKSLLDRLYSADMPGVQAESFITDFPALHIALLFIFTRVRGIKTQEAETHELQQFTSGTPWTYCSFSPVSVGMGPRGGPPYTVTVRLSS